MNYGKYKEYKLLKHREWNKYQMILPEWTQIEYKNKKNSENRSVYSFYLGYKYRPVHHVILFRSPYANMDASRVQPIKLARVSIYNKFGDWSPNGVIPKQNTSQYNVSNDLNQKYRRCIHY